MLFGQDETITAYCLHTIEAQVADPTVVSAEWELLCRASNALLPNGPRDARVISVTRESTLGGLRVKIAFQVRRDICGADTLATLRHIYRIAVGQWVNDNDMAQGSRE